MKLPGGRRRRARDPRVAPRARPRAARGPAGRVGRRTRGWPGPRRPGLSPQPHTATASLTVRVTAHLTSHDPGMPSQHRAGIALTQRGNKGVTKGVGESIYSGFTHNPHHLILDSVTARPEPAQNARADTILNRSRFSLLGGGSGCRPAPRSARACGSARAVSPGALISVGRFSLATRVLAIARHPSSRKMAAHATRERRAARAGARRAPDRL